MGYDKLALFSFRNAKLILIIWIALLIVFGYFAPKLPAVVRDHGLTSNGASSQVQRVLAERFGLPEHPLILVFETERPLSNEQFRAFVQHTLQSIRETAGLRRIIYPAGGDLQEGFAYALLDFEHPPYRMKPAIDHIRNLLPADGQVSVKLTGKPVVQSDVNEASRHDLARAELFGIPAALVIMWIAFGGFVSALIPILTGIAAVIGAMGVMAWAGDRLELSNFVLNVIPMVGLALSIDFALIMISRFREELAARPVESAFAVTMQTAGRAVLCSALCVFFGLLGILFIPLPMFVSMAACAILVLFISVLAAFTLVPALLQLLCPVILREGGRKRRSGHRTLWHAWSHYVMRRPARMGLFAVCLLTVCLLPLGQLRTAVPDAASLPEHYASRSAFEALQTHAGSAEISHVYLVAQGSSNRLHEEEWAAAYALAEQLARDPHVLESHTIFSATGLTDEDIQRLTASRALFERYRPLLQKFVRDNVLLYQVTIQGSPSSEAAQAWVRSWEEAGKSSTLPYLVGGEAKYQQEVHDVIDQNMNRVLLFILLSNFIVLFIAFRSLLIPLKTIAMNLLSLGASFGILAWIFEEGRFGMEPSAIAVMIPVFVFGLVFGISMDYGVFLLSRISEAYRDTQDNDLSVQAGLAATGRVITLAAAIMIAVTAPFALADVAGVKQLGIGIAAAIFIDATVIRMILVPSLMKLLGGWNWWTPRWLKL